MPDPYSDIENKAESDTKSLFGPGGYTPRHPGARKMFDDTLSGKLGKNNYDAISTRVNKAMADLGVSGIAGRIAVLQGLINQAAAAGDWSNIDNYMGELTSLQELMYAIDPSYDPTGLSSGGGGGGGGGVVPGMDPLSALAMIYGTAVDVGTMKAGAAAKALENQLAQAQLMQDSTHVMGFEPGGMANRFFGTANTPFNNDIGKYTKVGVNDPMMVVDQMNGGFNDIVAAMQAYFADATADRTIGGGGGGYSTPGSSFLEIPEIPASDVQGSRLDPNDPLSALGKLPQITSQIAAFLGSPSFTAQTPSPFRVSPPSSSTAPVPSPVPTPVPTPSPYDIGAAIRNNRTTRR